MELRTERLILRDYREDDFDAVHAFASDPQIATYVDWGPNQLEDTRAFLADCRLHQQALPRTTFTLALTASIDAPFGSAELATHGQHAKMGYVVRRDLWGQGFATEAAAAMLKFGFETLRLRRIQATCRPENIASARVLDKIGMIRECLVPHHVHIGGHWRDSYLYAATNTTSR